MAVDQLDCRLYSLPYSTYIIHRILSNSAPYRETNSHDMRLLTLALPLLHLSIAAAATTTYTISHRLLPHHPASTSEPDVFQKYGTISLPDDSTSILRIDRSEGGGGNVGGGSGGGWYQVLITGEGLGEGIMSSTKGVRLIPLPQCSQCSTEKSHYVRGESCGMSADGSSAT